MDQFIFGVQVDVPGCLSGFYSGWGDRGLPGGLAAEIQTMGTCTHVKVADPGLEGDNWNY